MLRPKSLDDIIGQDDIVKTIKNQFLSGRIPHFFIISGEIGTGKTTLARIIAMIIQENTIDFNYDNYKKYDIREINTPDKNGIDDIRSIIENLKIKPLASRAKVFILDEAHQLTNSAQNALLTVTEDAYNHVFFIFCTSNLPKIITALKRRAFILQTKTLDSESTDKLLRTVPNVDDIIDIILLKEHLQKYDITSPGLILQAAERFASSGKGTEPEIESNLDTLLICREIAKGSWLSVSKELKKMKKEDTYMVRNCVLGYLKTILFTGKDAIKISKAIKMIGESPVDEVSVFLANICLACAHIRS